MTWTILDEYASDELLAQLREFDEHNEKEECEMNNAAPVPPVPLQPVSQPTSSATKFVDNVNRLFRVDNKMQITPAEHAGWGMVDEIGELTKAFKKHYAYGSDLDIDNVIEEIGDFMFYLVAHEVSLGHTDLDQQALISCAITNSDTLTVADTRVNVADQLNGILNRFTEYTTGDECRYELIVQLDKLARTLNSSLEECLKRNIEKLEKRYPKGNFNAADALNRADKSND